MVFRTFWTLDLVFSDFWTLVFLDFWTLMVFGLGLIGFSGSGYLVFRTWTGFSWILDLGN